MRKIEWLISVEEYGPRFRVVSNSRSNAIAIAEADWLKNDFKESTMPTFTARKVKESDWYHPLLG